TRQLTAPPSPDVWTCSAAHFRWPRTWRRSVGGIAVANRGHASNQRSDSRDAGNDQTPPVPSIIEMPPPSEIGSSVEPFDVLRSGCEFGRRVPRIPPGEPPGVRAIRGAREDP